MQKTSFHMRHLSASPFNIKGQPNRSYIMRHLLLVIILISMHTISFAQKSQQRNDSVFALVKQYINEKNSDGIYAMAGEKFRTHLSKDVFTNFATNNLFPLGSIQASSLLKFSSGLSHYKLSFGAGDFELLLSLDDSNKIEAFAMRPYTAEKTGAVPSSNPMHTAMDMKLDSIARKYIQKANTVGLCIGIIKDGKMSTYAYGETVKGNNTLPDKNTIFEIGSITKTFTATLLAYYADMGKVHLTDEIIKYLPDSVAANKELKGITLLMLSNHTSGLPRMPDNYDDHMSDSLNPYKDYSKDLLFSYLAHCKLDTVAGADYSYSNVAVGLLGVVLEHVSGKPYEQMVEELICKPLQMTRTVQHITKPLIAHQTTVYNEKGEPTPLWDFEAIAGAGAIRSTLEDMLRYANANMKTGTDPLSKAIALTHKITNTSTMEVGLGWHGGTSKDEHFLWHNGGTFGSSSYLAFIPGKNIAVVVLSNAAASTDEIGKSILKALQ